MKILTVTNAHEAKIIRSIANPEWGNKKFNHNSQSLDGGRFCSTHGTGSNQALLFEGEYKFWEVIA